MAEPSMLTPEQLYAAHRAFLHVTKNWDRGSWTLQPEYVTRMFERVFGAMTEALRAQHELDAIAARRYHALREFPAGALGRHFVASFARNEPDRPLYSASDVDGFADQLGHVPTSDAEVTHAGACPIREPSRDRIVDTREHALRMAAAVLRGRLTMAERTRDDLADILMEYARAEPRDA